MKTSFELSQDEIKDAVSRALADYFYTDRHMRGHFYITDEHIKIATYAVMQAEKLLKSHCDKQLDRAVNELSDATDLCADLLDMLLDEDVDDTVYYAIIVDGKVVDVSTSDLLIRYSNSVPQLATANNAQFILANGLYHAKWMDEPSKKIAYKNADVQMIPKEDFDAYYFKLNGVHLRPEI